MQVPIQITMRQPPTNSLWLSVRLWACGCGVGSASSGSTSSSTGKTIPKPRQRADHNYKNHVLNYTYAIILSIDIAWEVIHQTQWLCQRAHHDTTWLKACKSAWPTYPSGTQLLKHWWRLVNRLGYICRLLCSRNISKAVDGSNKALTQQVSKIDFELAGSLAGGCTTGIQ